MSIFWVSRTRREVSPRESRTPINDRIRKEVSGARFLMMNAAGGGLREKPANTSYREHLHTIALEMVFRDESSSQPPLVEHIFEESKAIRTHACVLACVRRKGD